MGRYVIFGANGGIGEATARRLALQAHSLLLIGRRENELSRIAQELGAEWATADVEDGKAMQRLADEIGPVIDGLVFAVGTINLKPFSRLTNDDFLHDFRVNALGAALAVQACLPALQASQNGASVVFFSTVAVEQGFPAHASIAMAKGAVVGLMRSLAAEFAPAIRVNAIAPSLVDTPLGRTVASNEKMAEAVAKLHAIPRLGDADEIAALVIFLLSPEAGWITGQVIGVDGGRSSLRTGRA